MKSYLAIDLGASSGRAILGRLDKGKLSLEEIHRFHNGAIEVCGNLHWNLLGLYVEIKKAIAITADRDITLSGLAIDTWGVDFALLDRHGSFLGFPYHYRDRRTDNVFDYAFDHLSREEYYAATGIQFIPFNTIFQLLAMKHNEDPALKVTDRILLMPNALTYMLCGDISAEYTIATTTQAYNPISHDWAWEVTDRLGLPRDIFPDLKPPGTVAGTLHESICRELNCPPISVILVGSHDTASAVAAVPADPDSSWAYLSSGTWSLLGRELQQPLMTDAARSVQFTNEGGIEGRIRFHTNIMGMWLIEQSKTTWKNRGQDYSYQDLSAAAAAAEPFRSLIDPNHPSFMAPGDMPLRIQQFCRETGQPIPETHGQIIRCAIDSLAFRYRQTFEDLERVTAAPVNVLHLVGGGARNTLTNQAAANVIEKPVIAGPYEATAIGNILTQAMATGEVKDLAELRQIVKNSFPTEHYEPQDRKLWQEGYSRYRAICR